MAEAGDRGEGPGVLVCGGGVVPFDVDGALAARGGVCDEGAAGVSGAGVAVPAAEDGGGADADDGDGVRGGSGDRGVRGGGNSAAAAVAGAAGRDPPAGALGV